MAKSGIKIFNLVESYGGGGSIFDDGTYRVVKALHVMFDFGGTFKGKDGDGACCLMFKLQAVDPKTHEDIDGKEPVVQYWGAGEETEPLNKGKEIGMRADATHDVIWKGSDYFKFMEQLVKAGFDADAVEDESDVSATFEGKVFEFGKITDTYQAKDKGVDLDGKGKGDGKPKEPRKIVVVTDANPKPVKGSGSKSKESAKPSATEDEGKGGDDPKVLVEAFLKKTICVEDNAEGIEKIVARSMLNKAITKAHDADKAKECIILWNKKGVLEALLDGTGWEVDGDNIKKKGK